MAAAFFVLAADVTAAAEVCINELADAQRALMLCRLLDASHAVPAKQGASSGFDFKIKSHTFWIILPEKHLFR